MKRYNEQPDFNSQLKNEDALYKFLAYSGMLEKKRRADIDKTRKNNELVYGIENFEEFYKQELQRDAKREPRQINPAEYAPKRVDNSKAHEGFRTTAERKEDYFREYEIFKENKSKFYFAIKNKLQRSNKREINFSQSWSSSSSKRRITKKSRLRSISDQYALYFNYSTCKVLFFKKVVSLLKSHYI